MDCSACGRRNDERARYCEKCGEALFSDCPACGEENRAGVAHCKFCGAKVALVSEVLDRDATARRYLKAGKTSRALKELDALLKASEGGRLGPVASKVESARELRQELESRNRTANQAWEEAEAAEAAGEFAKAAAAYEKAAEADPERAERGSERAGAMKNAHARAKAVARRREGEHLQAGEQFHVARAMNAALAAAEIQPAARASARRRRMVVAAVACGLPALVVLAWLVVLPVIQRAGAPGVSRAYLNERLGEMLARPPPGAQSYTEVDEDALRTLAKSAAWGPDEPRWNRQGLRVLEHAATGLRFVVVPAGSFDMGSPPWEGGDWYEQPRHRVQIRHAFLLCATECTQGAWLAGGGAYDPHWRGATLPIELVSWDECHSWCSRHGLRLPSESEWEYACRAGSTGKWCFGDDESKLGEYAWIRSNSGIRTHPVGQRLPNGWGLYDMHGNVYEWCEDGCGPYSEAPNDGSARTAQGGASDRVFRGGGWYDRARYCRSASRGGILPGSRGYDLGFRPAVSLP